MLVGHENFHRQYSCYSTNYLVSILRQALRRRKTLKAMLQSSPDITTGHYCRLMALCISEITFIVPIGVYNIVINATPANHVGPYVSWESIHAEFSHIPRISKADLQGSRLMVLLESFRWIYVFCALIIFPFFGWGREAREGYCRVFQVFARYLGLRSVQSARKIPKRSVPFVFIMQAELMFHWKGM